MLIFILLGTVSINAQNTYAADSGKSQNAASEEAVEVPDDLSKDKVHVFLSTLSDGQVRRLLIQELKKEASKKLTQSEIEDESDGLTGLIKKIHFISNIIQWRVYELKSGAGVIIWPSGSAPRRWSRTLSPGCFF